MTSSSSLAASRPSWQKALLAIPESHRSNQQTTVIKSFLLLEDCDPIVFSKYDDVIHHDYNIKRLFQSLCNICQFLAANAEIEALRFYLPEKQLHSVMATDCFLNQMCIRQIFFVDCSKEKNNPENLVLSLFAAAIAVRYQFMFAEVSAKVDQATRVEANTKIFQYCTRIRDFVVNETGSLLSKLDICLTCNAQTRKFPFNATFLTNSITRGLNSLYCFMTFDSIPITLDIRQTPIARSNVHEFMKDLKPMLEPYLDVAMGNFDLRTFENQMRTLNWCMKLLPHDGLLSEWGELTEVYLKVLRNAIKLATKEGEIYYVGHINRVLLKTLIRGNSKDNYGYAQVEEVARNLAAALKACEDWAPPVWKNEVEGLLEVVNDDIVPKIRRLSRDQWSVLLFSESEESVGRQKFREKVIKDGGVLPPAQRSPDGGKSVKTCAFCGKTSKQLKKCSACEAVWYCSSQCQKQDWKDHKKICKLIKTAMRQDA